jgi:hypothetical protein
MKKILLIVVLFSTIELFASTIIVNSLYDPDNNPGSLGATAAVEDGLMNSLFDFGLIMFSTVNSKSYIVEGAEDARFMLTIEIADDNLSLSYQLQATVNGLVIDSGVITIEDVQADRKLDNEKLYYLIGEEVAKRLQQFF